MQCIENPLDTQRHMLKLLAAASHPLQYHPVEIHKRIKPGWDGKEPESWEKPIYIESKYDHLFPRDTQEMPLDERPTDAGVIKRDYSLLRVSSGSHVVFEVVWNEDGWFGHIKPGAWEVIFLKWTVYW